MSVLRAMRPAGACGSDCAPVAAAKTRELPLPMSAPTAHWWICHWRDDHPPRLDLHLDPLIGTQMRRPRHRCRQTHAQVVAPVGVEYPRSADSSTPAPQPAVRSPQATPLALALPRRRKTAACQIWRTLRRLCPPMPAALLRQSRRAPARQAALAPRATVSSRMARQPQRRVVWGSHPAWS